MWKGGHIMTFMQVQVKSDVLQMELPVWVSLPQKEAAGKSGFRVLWLLHGGGGNQMDWLTCTKIREQAERYGWAVVMPTSMDSCFIDMAKGEEFGRFIGEELPETMQKLFPCFSLDREDNVISGFSNGGYGCLIAGLTYPDAFGWIAAFAAGDKADADFSYRMAEKEKFFGDGDMQKSSYSTKYLARCLAKKKGTMPKVFHAYGEGDPWRNMNELVRDDFLSYSGNPYHYQCRVIKEKKHEWSMCEEAMEQFLEYYKEEQK